MIVATPPSKGKSSRKRRRETEEVSSPSADAVSEKNLKEAAPIILARWKTAAYKGSSAPRKLAEVMEGLKASTKLTSEEDFRTQKATPKGVRRVDKRGRWTSAMNGSRPNTRRPLGNK